ncbi:head completion/stabilization protein [Sphingobium cloacae]|uniref:Bacteriophage P2 GPL capsid protein n=1 Tax=Sphingobium cloacae TaxID=120107 RepID=A0A1E1F5G7_9SPHN|nr:head completion/stabilization protein [Sphingobium cloacae]BAV65766.1 bacteriophage P2 GPL capsid protein [Sphingobium cloacae]
MSSFVALPPSAASEPPPAETVVVNDGFFPDIDPARVRDDARISTSITPARLRAAIIGAIMRVEIDLRAFAIDAIAEGHDKLANVPAPDLDGESVQVIRYRRAIALFAKAELIERHRDFDLTAAGVNQSDELEQSIGDLRRDAQHAIRDMLGRTRTTVDLI